jgi:hypothetical protein
MLSEASAREQGAQGDEATEPWDVDTRNKKTASISPIQVAHSRQLLLVVVLVVGVGSRSLASCLSSTAYVRSESRTFPLLRA